ncbi:MAG: glutathione S-transferase family protein, partial [Elainella sp.]
MAKSALPGQLVIRSGRWVWSTMWHTMMSQMAPRSQDGGYLRPDSQFRQQELESEAGRYQLIVGLGCPWAHRTLVVRALKGLEAAIPIALVAPSPEAGGWVFEQPEAGCRTVRQLYELTQPNYRGRSTVPILWDSRQKQIINNESAEIIVILNRAFQDFAQRPDLDLYPTALQAEIDRWNAKIYPAVNNGVYRCGFAQTQTAYSQAVAELFACLDELDSHLTNQRYLCGSQLTLADLRLFTTLFRFDTVYHSLFKCSRR